MIFKTHYCIISIQGGDYVATYKTSKDSKNRIIETCKELFYLQGYTKTTYIDICKKASSNPGLINYYFKTKQNIAAHIYGEFMSSIKESVKAYLIHHHGVYDLQYGTALEIRIFTELLKRDEYLRTFYYEICNTGLEFDSDVIYKFYKLHVDTYNLPFSEDEIKLIQTTIVGAGIGIIKKMIEGYFSCDEETVFNFRIRTMYKIMNVSDERVDEILNETIKIFNQMKFKIQDYFIFTLEM